MYPSRKIGPICRSIVGELRNADPSKIPSIREKFNNSYTRNLPRQLPDEFNADLADYAWETLQGEPRLDLPGDLADLVSSQYDDAADPLLKEDWEFLASLVSDFDQDLGLELMEYLLMRIVEHHGLD